MPHATSYRTRPAAGAHDLAGAIVRPATRMNGTYVRGFFRLALKVDAVFNAVVEDQLFAVSPCRKIARQPVGASRVVPLSVDQVERLVTAAHRHCLALVITAVGTGLRQGKALGLRQQDVDFLRREVHVRHQFVSVPGVEAHLGPPKTASCLHTFSHLWPSSDDKTRQVLQKALDRPRAARRRRTALTIDLHQGQRGIGTTRAGRHPGGGRRRRR